MSNATINSGYVVGVQGHPTTVTAEVSAAKLPDFQVYGLPELPIRELRVRVRSAIRHAGFDFPDGHVQVRVEVPVGAPSLHGNVGITGFDLPVALAILVASGQCPQPAATDKFIGELSLTGAVRPIVGLEAAVAASPDSVWLVPTKSVRSADVFTASPPLHAETLGEVVAILKGGPCARWPEKAIPFGGRVPALCWSDVRGHTAAKRALEIAAAGGHNVLLIGTPGTGKTMLARRLPTVLPPLAEAESRELTAIYSAAGLLPERSEGINTRPFRAPHHTASAAAMVGGGSTPRPGECTLAHRGVLFLDELPEFPAHVAYAIAGVVHAKASRVTRNRLTCEFPADALVVAAMTPCPCGHHGDGSNRCSCTPLARDRYWKRTEPFQGLFDMVVQLPRQSAPEIIAARDAGPGEPSSVVRERVAQARALPNNEQDAVQRLARTIANLDGSATIEPQHVAEALTYRWPLVSTQETP